MEFPGGLAELHTHLGGSVSSDVMWSLAHEQGMALPTRDYWEFDRMVTVSDPRGVPDLDSLDRIYHLTELIQSSPLAVERVEVGHAARVGDGDERVELPVVPGGQRDPLLVRQAPEDVRGDRAAQVGVQLGEA